MHMFFAAFCDQDLWLLAAAMAASRLANFQKAILEDMIKIRFHKCSKKC